MQLKLTKSGRLMLASLITVSVTACVTAPPETPSSANGCEWVTMPAYTCSDIDQASSTLIDWLVDHIDATAAVCDFERPKCKE